MSRLTENIYNFFIVKRSAIIFVFKMIYFLLIIFVISAFLFSYFNNQYLLHLNNYGTFFGKSALLTFILTLLPGIGERLMIKNQLLSILKIYRRYIGILMYILTLAHTALVKILFLTSLKDLLSNYTFEIMGSVASLILFFLFITSNNISLSRLRINWYRLHRLIYLAMFFIFLHVALQRLSIWTVLMGLVIILQIISFAIVYKRTNSFTGVFSNPIMSMKPSFKNQSD